MQLDPLAQIHPWVILATVLMVTATYFALRAVFVRPYLRVLEERYERVQAGEAMLDEADRVREEATADAEALIERAREEADDIRRAAREEAERYRKTRIQQANAEIDQLLAEGRDEISAARDAQMATVRGQAAECVGLACERLLGRRDDELVGTTVDRVLQKLK